MFRSSILVSALVGVMLTVLTSACESSSDDHKVDGTQKDTTSPNLTEMQQAEQKAAEAQAETQRRAADSQAEFARKKTAYHASMDQSLASVDQLIHRVEAQDKRATGKAKTDLDDKLKKIHDMRASLADNYTEVDTSTISGWEETEVRLNGQLSDLQQLVGTSIELGCHRQRFERCPRPRVAT